MLSASHSGTLVHNQISFAAVASNSDLHTHANAGLFNHAGQRRDGLPPTITNAHLPFHLLRRLIWNRRSAIVKGGGNTAPRYIGRAHTCNPITATSPMAASALTA